MTLDGKSENGMNDSENATHVCNGSSGVVLEATLTSKDAVTGLWPRSPRLFRRRDRRQSVKYSNPLAAKRDGGGGEIDFMSATDVEYTVEYDIVPVADRSTFDPFSTRSFGGSN